LSHEDDPKDFMLRVEWSANADGKKPPSSYLSYLEIKKISLSAVLAFWEDIYR
jgi:hypothetical protein